MSLSDCIRKAGKALNQRDADAISDLADEIEATGVDRLDAEKQAVEQHITDVQTEIEGIAPQEVFVQEGDDTARGMIEILENEHTIRLSNASDMSTFLHESAHLFVSMEGKLAQKFGLTANNKALLEHVGAESFETLTVDQHETLAESFEVYMREGYAPSLKLADAFAVIRTWLLDVYENIRALGRQKLDDDLRGIFDRMLATEEEIQQVAASPAYQELFRSKEQAGMTDAEWKKYIENKDKRDSRALTTVQEKLVKQLKARKSKEWKAERKILAEEEMERLAEEPVYKALTDTLKRTDEIMERPLDRESVKVILGVDNVTGKWIRRTSNDGSDVDMVAEGHGFPDGPAMIRAMNEAPSIKDAAMEIAEAKMLEKHGDILNDGSIEAEVQAAMHNEAQAEMLLKEINKISRQPKINRGVLKAEARRMIGTMKNSEIRPSKFYRNEIKAAQRAAKATTPEEQLRAKQQQLANHYLYKEALKAKENLVKWRKHIDHVRKHEYNTNQVDVSHIQQMKLMANLYRSKDQNTPENVAKAMAFFDAQRDAIHSFVRLQDPQLLMYVYAKNRVIQAEGNPNAVAEAQAVVDNFRFKVYEDLTLDEMQGAYNTLRNLRYAGGKLMEENLEFNMMLDSLTKSVDDRGGKDYVVPAAPPAGKKFQDTAKDYTTSLVSLRNMVRELDGFDEHGLAAKNIYHLVEDGENALLRLNREDFELYEELLNDVDKVSISRFGNETITKEDGTEFKLHSEGRLMLALYWGTESSREAIREGHGVTDTDVMRMLQKMSPDELKLVNAIWEVNESKWPEASSEYVKRYGQAPEKLDPTPFEVNGVKMTGGHMQLFYVGQAQEFADTEVDQYKQVSTDKAGSMIERVGSGGRMVDLDKNNIARSLQDLNRATAFMNPSRRLAGIVNSKKFKNTVVQKHGEQFYKAFIKTLQNVTSGKMTRESNEYTGQFFKLIRRAATYRYLMFSVRNTVQQVTALLPAIKSVGVANFADAAIGFMDPRQFHENMELVKGKSEFMRNRSSLVNREAAEYMKQFTVGGRFARSWNWLVRHGFTPQTFIDSLIAYPTWLAAYRKAMLQHGDERMAISDADTTVAESVGSGSDLHLASSFQSTNNQSQKFVTAFGSFFNNYYQRTYKATKGYSKEGFKENKADAFWEITLQPMVMGVVAGALIMSLPGDDEESLIFDDEMSFAEWTAIQTGSHLAGMFPFFRDLYSALIGFKSSGRIEAATSAPVKLIGEVVDIVEEDETAAKSLSSVIKVASTVVPMPGSGQVTRVLDFIDSDSQGNEEGMALKKSYQALVEGPDRNK